LDAKRLSARALLETTKIRACLWSEGSASERSLVLRSQPVLEKTRTADGLVDDHGLSLLIYSLAERKLRQELKEMNATVLDQRRKPTRDNNSLDFPAFEGLDILLVKQSGEVMFRQLLNLRRLKNK